MTTEEKNEQNGDTLNYLLIGSAVGAGVGLLSSSDKGKKVLKTLSTSQVAKMAGQELKKSFQDKITEQAVSSVKKSISTYMNKIEEKVPVPVPDKVTDKIDEKLGLDQGTENEEEENESMNEEEEKETENEEEESNSTKSGEFDELKEENENLNDRLDKIEQMLTKLTESK
ncbi:YtxH domain-containing protein [Salipaludibacillus daqingensis]|uniref:YtxH domain-containing protein n=1 Tax=Salipaludibacillus daqingensis TaxID=3041001 RepID=UPI002474BE67|nr:YtxH domain-containing protein [Salipaludibacillus daqingensis]